MAEQNRVVVTDEVWELLRQLSDMGIFGSGPSQTGALIIKEELRRLVTSGELEKLQAKVKSLGIGPKKPSEE